MNWREHVTVDPQVCHGQACFRGTWVPVAVVLDNLATGETIEAILKSYPTLSPEGSGLLSPTRPKSHASGP